MDAARELRELRRIERWLAVNDPDLAAALSTAPPRSRNRKPVRVAVDVLGVLCVVLGVLTGALLLVFTGCLVLMTGLCLHTTCRGRRQT
ncbi:Protein of unknown function [Lentzea fradiae]|uniref:DUF3040 domain-containing protein n=1 Tax=Lentzea fradiae TaxID=200378 RepID=A0A1G7VBU7_9PSEU|nr:DUF3040 domain-containing protein [Lentzea fradiae]SDG57315.1 Protein of unknown function [Lentzea fradiae]